MPPQTYTELETWGVRPGSLYLDTPPGNSYVSLNLYKFKSRNKLSCVVLSARWLNLELGEEVRALFLSPQWLPIETGVKWHFSWWPISNMITGFPLHLTSLHSSSHSPHCSHWTPTPARLFLVLFLQLGMFFPSTHQFFPHYLGLSSDDASLET